MSGPSHQQKMESVITVEWHGWVLTQKMDHSRMTRFIKHKDSEMTVFKRWAREDALLEYLKKIVNNYERLVDEEK